MKRELTIQDLAPYLPYRLTIHSAYNNRKERLIGICQLRDGYQIQCVCFHTNNPVIWEWRPEDFQPYLRRLSDYADVCGPAMCDLNCDIEDQICIADLANKQIGLHQVGYGVIQIMAEYHIDFANLIAAGLALPITEK